MVASHGLSRPTESLPEPLDQLNVPDPDARIAVLLPCYNEETTIAQVVTDFRRALPQASVYVYDNASTDHTASVARLAGATVVHVPARGKGNVVRRMFADIDADYYVLADGDGTYDAAAAPQLVATLCDRGLDMVVGRRIDEAETSGAYRRGHRFGNRLFTSAVRWIFGEGPEDMLSGYRAFSRRYVRSFPANSPGFEIETEMTVHALDLGVAFTEIPTMYGARPSASTSKLRTIPDGLRILRCIATLCKEYRPVRFYAALIALLTLCTVLLALVLPWDPAGAVGTGRQVVLGAALMDFGLVVVALILSSVSRNQREMKRVLYLAVSDRAAARRPQADAA